MTHLEESYVRELFEKIETGQMPKFYESVNDDVDWFVVNDRIKSFPLSGRYNVS